MTVTAREALLAAWPFSAQANIVGEEVDRALAVLNELGFVIVPREALEWLNGEAGTFEPPPGARGKFWWRSEFRRRAKLNG